MYEEHSNNIYKFAYRLTGNPQEAEDITQETFLKLYNHVNSHHNLQNPKAWIYRVAANTCYNLLKRNEKYRKILSEDGETIGNKENNRQNHIESEFIKNEEMQIIKNALKELPLRDRLVLELHQDGISYRDMARIIDVRKSSVRTILYRAIDKLERCIKGGKK